MQLKKLDYSFYKENAHLIQALDNHNGQWESGKTRGYGIVVISINNLTFGIPLRSNITHRAACLTRKGNPEKGETNKGLDFSKAVLITKKAYILNQPFKIPPAEHKEISDKEKYITEKFEKYVTKYIKAISKNDTNILGSKEYRHTTLQNYHAELLSN